MKEKENLCVQCPDEVRGLCCYYSCLIEGYNIILSRHPCKYLDPDKKICTIYKERFEKYPHCNPSIVGIGSLPIGCLYLIGNEDKEEHPKVHMKNIIDNLSPQGVMLYNVMNNAVEIEKIYQKPKVV